MIGGHGALERRLHHFLRRRRDHEERELEPVEAALEKVHERGDVAAQPDAPAGFDEVLAAHAPELRIVANQVRQLAALLHEVARRQPLDLLLEIRDPEQLAEDLARIVEAERLVEVRCEEKVLGSCHIGPYCYIAHI